MVERYDADAGGALLDEMRSLATTTADAEIAALAGPGIDGNLEAALDGFRRNAATRVGEVNDAGNLLVGMMSGVHARLA
ncbi:MAG: hypothetical protein AAGD35_22905 [Actinomycetota bacterium]